MKKTTSSKQQGLVFVAFSAILSMSACSIIPKPLDNDAHREKMSRDMDRLFSLAEVETIPDVISLEFATSRVFTHNFESRLFQLNEALATSQVTSDQMEMLPTLAASAGFANRNNDPSTIDTSTQSGEQRRNTANLSLSWNVLDFGLSYYTAKQNADRVLIAKQQRRRVAQELLREVHSAYWRVASVEPFVNNKAKIISDAQAALDDIRRIEQQQLSPLIDNLNQQRSLIELIASLQELQYQLEVDRATLASLMGLPPTTRLVLEPPLQQKFEVPKIKLDLAEMEQLALFQRPELIEERYNQRIDELEVRKAFLQLLPNVNLAWTAFYDGNSFLANNYWNEVSGRVAGNLLNLATGNRRLLPRRMSQEVSEMRRLALSMAVLTQVNISYQDYLFSLKEFDKMSDLNKIEQRLLELTRSGFESNAQSNIDLISAELRAMFSQINHYRAHARVQRAYSALLNSIGQDNLQSRGQQSEKVANEQLKSPSVTANGL